jgi:ribosome-associated protein
MAKSQMSSKSIAKSSPKTADDQPTRAEMKRRMDRLQDLGVRLTRLTDGKLSRIELPEPLLEAVLEARRLTSMAAKRRQLQFIGRIMEQFDTARIARDLRDVDVRTTRQMPQSPEVAAQPDAALTMARELMEQGDDILFSKYAGVFDSVTVQQIRQGLRAATKQLRGGAAQVDPAEALALKIRALIPLH